jgi:hypothetical protein
MHAVHIYPQQFTERKRSKKKEERPTTAFFSSENNANGKENGLGNYYGPSTSFGLILG